MRAILHRLAALAALPAVGGCTPGDAGGSGRALPAGWERTEVLGLTLAAPGRFGLRTIELPKDVEATLEEMQSYSVRTDSLEVAVTRGTYLEGLPVELMGSARGAVEALRSHPGVSDMTYSHAQTEVSGVPAVRTAWQNRFGGHHLQGEILTILLGRVLWQVEVTGGAGETTSEAASTVLESVRIAPR
ncbi:MAG TPA: hypothetical protein VHG08_16045 [Longimicrobium sp.]|nr:hypothetical protein [Longimicrobium sp.]